MRVAYISRSLRNHDGSPWFTVITLDKSEYYNTIERAAENGFTSGRIYDALLLCCAAKAKAGVIYTWNLKHFRAIDPKLADRIRTP